LELQHERHVLEHEPWHRAALEKPEDLADKPRILATDADRATSLAQVLTGKSSADYIDALGQQTHTNDVRLDSDAGETSGKNGRRLGLDLAEHYGLVPSIVEPKLEATDSGEKTSYLQARIPMIDTDECLNCGWTLQKWPLIGHVAISRFPENPGDRHLFGVSDPTQCFVELAGQTHRCPNNSWFRRSASSLQNGHGTSPVNASFYSMLL
jgi:hypothetical protein